MKLNRIFAIVVIVLLSISMLAGCGKPASQEGQGKQENQNQQQEAKSKKVIGVLLCDFSDQFQVYMKKGMEEAASKLGDEYEVLFYDAKYDANEQLKQAENLITQKVDAIVLMAVDREAAKPMVQSIHDAGIPLISVNRMLANQDLAVSYVGSDDVQAGEIQMKAMAEALKGKGNIVVLHGSYGHEPEIRRQQGYMNILKDYPDIKIVAENTGDWYRDKGMEVMENWLQSKIKIDGVAAHNDEMAIGASIAIEDAGLTGKIVVSGIDATPEAIDFVKKGKMNFTVFQDAKGQGRTSIEVAAKAAKGEKVEKEYMIPFELVTPDKADEYVKRYQ
ncbi:sugar ABC transporter substrate-binding protein [Thermoanaerobacterium sp. DL9XJH110]|uniref:sugar ABC transporter substrate-binding protein n=1 Tax=Thermoanaerobacterium sp. DL9XJH110 TaxID=3386643 RepID=UPI003BB7824D